jgi:hypothetical protein
MAKKETVLSIVKEIRAHLVSRFPHEPVLKPETIITKGRRFIRNKDGTVTDKQLNLTWYPTLPKKLSWKEAKKECEKIGCRLPTTHELFSLVDINKYDLAINEEIFPDTKTDDWFWTQDTCPWNAGYARIVLFGYGYVNYGNKDYNNYVRPVRSSQ